MHVEIPMRKLLFPPICALFLILAGCSETPTTAVKKEPEKPAEPLTGQSALFRMFQVARSWGPDVQVLKMISSAISEVPDVPRGKAAVWEEIGRASCRERGRGAGRD